MSDENDSFRFDIDTKDAVSNVMGLQKKISELGESDISGLVKGFTELALPIAAVGTAIFAVKKAFDFSLEGAQLERINQQFDLLAESAGQSGDLLKSKIEESIGPTNNLEEAIKSANKALISLGPELSKNIPQYFEIARKAALAFGGDINERFEQISQAVLVGNTRMLRGIGLKVDAVKAEQNYAKSIGVTVEQLSQQGKQQAISNAILDAANNKYKDIKANNETLDVAFKTFKNTMTEVGEGVALAFNKMFGPAFTRALEYFDGLLKGVSNRLKANFGEGLEQSAAKISVLNDKIVEANENLDYMKKDPLQYNSSDLDRARGKIEGLNRQLEDQLSIQIKLKAAAKAKQDELAGEKGGPENTDKQKDLAEQAKFENDMFQATATRIKDEMESETDFEKYKQELKAQEEIVELQFAAKIKQINTEVGEGKKYTAIQAADIIREVEADKTAKIKALQGQEADAAMKAYDNRVRYASTSADKEIAQAQKVAAETKKSINDGAVLMQTKLDVTKSRSVEAFKAMAAGQKSASEIAKTFVFGSLGDIAEARGELHLANGLAEIFAGNPAGAGEVAQGGALIALGAALQGAAGGSSSGAPSGGGGGGGASPAAASPTTTSSSQLNAQPQAQGKSVTIEVQGHYFETQQTQQAMIELIRNATDATDFKYQQIGVS